MNNAAIIKKKKKDQHCFHIWVYLSWLFWGAA